MTTAALVDRIRNARSSRTAVRVTGAGTWLDAGRACAATDAVQPDRGIVTYEPGDFVLTARAGTSLEEIRAVTSGEGQWLTLDPHGSASGTLGATVATASWGPLASAYGTPRDHVLGCEFVTGAGAVVNAGGRVVKNVAGFDLVRLLTGAWGTVGILAELTVRLRSRPEQDVTMAIAAQSPTAARAWVASSVYTPLAAELLSPALAARVTGSASANLLLRIGGNTPLVTAMGDSARQLGESVALDAGVWAALAGLEPQGALTFRLSTLPSNIGPLWARAVELTEMFGGVAHATITRGVVRCVIPPCDEAGMKRLAVALTAIAAGATCIGERLPAALWPIASRARTTDALSLAVRRAFDPDRILNPGILGAP